LFEYSFQKLCFPHSCSRTSAGESRGHSEETARTGQVRIWTVQSLSRTPRKLSIFWSL
jgi:hypothetical protein